MTKTPCDALWHRLRIFQFDDPDARLDFSRRLARENAWSLEFAQQVIEEYKRFCYLALRAGHPVTPSDQVDQAWHLHLVYTRNYWQQFCGEVLEAPLHHGPTRGGALENAKYHDWYSATLVSYQQHFGAPPPSDIWPAPSARFRDAGAFRRVNAAQHWVLPKPALGAGLKRALLPGLAVGLTLAACAAQAAVGSDPGAETVLVVILLLFFLIICLFAIRSVRRRKGRQEGDDGCDTGCGYTGRRKSPDRSDRGDSEGADSGCGDGCSS